ncbi:hypothetical protein AGABI1DRAFT_85895 [Agaricus bisporus var. burnettii JB137-S8]|uniref:CsbD-like domain-containing protein n=1 Tax=Agaricus bisporus var. burnettii (strain JB137-S8 / ATCC MYA-4627 / FGSC 10392) TaxID=597362 RepID=K5X5J2_AGABU|nr:uncharacterized protein AGABI1DRAFT_85895 [Agaricus bisporus var. burnettii JB137-S8]EKM78207.1 hypothetical protein AGABI1DRAFT_85895 [Agaricus bisporus var. burnettii JB137-S8]
MTSNPSLNNTASGEPSKVSGQLNSAMGTAKETVGKMTGATSLQQSGKEDHAAGEAENKAAQTKGHAEGMTDQIAGKKDSMIGAMTGDKKQQTSGNMREDKGQAEKKMNS